MFEVLDKANNLACKTSNFHTYLYFVANPNNINEVNIFWMYSLAFHIHEQNPKKKQKINM
jgi:hypothetical protein